MLKGFSMNVRMSRRIGWMVLSVAFFGVTTLAHLGEAKENALNPSEHTAMLQSCAKACSDCQRACDACAAHCSLMLEGGKKEHLKALTTCQDCATTCSAAAQIVSRGGPFSITICTACAETCASCAKECASFSNDKLMKVCADECSKCEQACRNMLKHAASSK